MNPSLFSFEESSVWDPKVIRECLVVSEDQLNKLDSLPGWVKVQDNRDTLRLEKEFSIEGSQSQCSINVVPNSQRIEKNRELFNEQIESRQATLETYKVYGNKLARSLSLFTISESSKNLVNNKTFTRASSFQNLCELSDASKINFSGRQFLPDICDRNIISNKPIKNINLSSECKISYSESEKSEELVLSKKINSRTMEIISQLPATIPNPIENDSLHFESTKVSNGILPAENAATVLSDQHVEDVIMESVSDNLHSKTLDKDNDGAVPIENAAVGSDQFIKPDIESVSADLPSEIEKENNGTVPVQNFAPCSSDVLNESTKDANSASSSLKKFNENCIPVSNENCKPDSSVVKEKEAACNMISTNKVSPCSYNVSDESVKAANSITISTNKFHKTHVSDASENCKSDSIIIKEITTNVVPVSENSTLSLNAQDQEKVLSSNLCKTNEIIPDKCSVSNMISDEKIALKDDATMISAKSDGLNIQDPCPSKSQVVISPGKTSYISKKEANLENENLVRNCDSDMKEIKLESEQKKCEPTKSSADNEASSGDNEASFSKKRKLETRNKRSKRLKSDDKQGNIKIRSIKKVGEICYSVEEVKTMLDIIKHIL